MFRTNLIWLALLGSGFSSDPAQKVDLLALKGQARLFETVFSESLKQKFKNPYAITAGPRAGYIPDYGIVVSLQVRVGFVPAKTPFGPVRKVDSQVETREQQLQGVQDASLHALAEFGGTIKQLQESEKLTIMAHIDDRRELDPLQASLVLVLTAIKKDIDAVASRKISFEEFSNRVKVKKY